VGFGTIVAGIYFVAVLVMSMYVYASSVTQLSNTSLQSIEGATNIQLERLRSSANISNITVSQDASKLFVTVINTGDLKVSSTDYQSIDVLLTYTDNASGISQTYWCYYQSLDPTQNRWSLNSTIIPNPYPATVDPLDWNPSKTLAIVIQLGTPHHMRPGTGGYLKIVLPQGSSTALSFLG
jgi:hypothetical protein